MSQKLQRNFDIIQYLITNASPEQLNWRETACGPSLVDIIGCLRDAEREHSAAGVLDDALESALELPDCTALNSASDNIEPAMAEFARHRQYTIKLMRRLSALPPATALVHKRFGRLTLPQLIAKIDSGDQMYIRQLEAIIQAMPLNPLMGRAIYEIEHYYRQYQPYLEGVNSVLDIGVGSGLALRYMMLQKPEVTFAGVDVRDLRLPYVDVPLQLYDGQTLPFTRQQFDISLLFYVLHHCLKPQAVLAEAKRVTRQTLIIIEEFDAPNTDDISLDLTERQSHKALGLPADLPYQLFDQPEFEAMLRTHHLVELERQHLPSETTRPVQKFLYVMGVGSW